MSHPYFQNCKTQANSFFFAVGTVILVSNLIQSSEHQGGWGAGGWGESETRMTVSVLRQNLST